MKPDWYLTPPADLDHSAIQEARERQSQLTKPPGSLGRLENLAIQLAGILGTPLPPSLTAEIVIFAADHGICAENISAFPQSVTGQMLLNFANGGAAISVLSRLHQAKLTVINLGTVEPVAHPCIDNAIIAPGTRNFLHEKAMTRQQLQQALAIGKTVIADLEAPVFIGGEMGIGNTTSAAALMCALTGAPAEQFCGAGTGLDNARIQHKTRVVQQALARHLAGQHSMAPLQALETFGGFEIAALAGAYIAAAQARKAVLVDGFICSAAAHAACQLNPAIKPYLVFSHRSGEQGHEKILQALAVTPLLDLSMRLGEASGAAIAFPLLLQACDLHNQMATFAEAAVSSRTG